MEEENSNYAPSQGPGRRRQQARPHQGQMQNYNTQESRIESGPEIEIQVKQEEKNNNTTKTCRSEVVDPDRNNKVHSKSNQMTDPLCIPIFILISFLILFGIIESLVNGDVRRLGIPHDSDSRGCGLDESVKDYPYIYFVAPFDKFTHRTVCVKSCPPYNVKYIMEYELLCAPNSLVPSCSFSFGVNGNLEKIMLKYRTVEYLNKICLSDVTQYYSIIKKNIKPNNEFENILIDIKTGWKIIIISYSISILLGFVLLISLIYIPKITVWMTFIGAILSSAGLSYLFIINSLSTNNLEKKRKQDPMMLNNIARSDGYYYATLHVLGIYFSVFAVLITITFVIISKSKFVCRVSEIFEENSRDLKRKSLIIIIPFMASLLSLLYFLFWLWTSLYILSNGEVQSILSQNPFQIFKINTLHIVFFVIYFSVLIYNLVLLLLWSVYLVSEALILADSEEESGNSLILKACLIRSFKNYFGSIGLGSFLFLLFLPLRLVILLLVSLIQSIPVCNCLTETRFFACLSGLNSGFLGKISLSTILGVALFKKNFLESGRSLSEFTEGNTLEYQIDSFKSSAFFCYLLVLISTVSIIAARLFFSNEYYYSTMSSNLLPIILVGNVSVIVGAIFFSGYYISVKFSLLKIDKEKYECFEDEDNADYQIRNYRLGNKNSKNSNIREILIDSIILGEYINLDIESDFFDEFFENESIVIGQVSKKNIEAVLMKIHGKSVDVFYKFLTKFINETENNELGFDSKNYGPIKLTFKSPLNNKVLIIKTDLHPNKALWAPKCINFRLQKDKGLVTDIITLNITDPKGKSKTVNITDGKYVPQTIMKGKWILKLKSEKYSPEITKQYFIVENSLEGAEEDFYLLERPIKLAKNIKHINSFNQICIGEANKLDVDENYINIIASNQKLLVVGTSRNNLIIEFSILKEGNKNCISFTVVLADKSNKNLELDKNLYGPIEIYFDIFKTEKEVQSFEIKTKLVPNKIYWPPSFYSLRNNRNDLLLTEKIEINIIDPNGNISTVIVTDSKLIPKIEIQGTWTLRINSNKFGLTNAINYIVYEGLKNPENEIKILLNPKDNTPRITLEWGQHPQDLDLHCEDSMGTHVYFGNEQQNNIELDVDQVLGYGPETITLKNGIMKGVTYWFYVHLFSGEGKLATSNAKIRTYEIDGINEILVPNDSSSGNPLYWNLFKIIPTTDNNYTVEIHNKLSDSPNRKF